MLDELLHGAVFVIAAEIAVNALVREDDERLFLGAVEILRDEGHRMDDHRILGAGRGGIGRAVRRGAGVTDLVHFGDVAQLHVPLLNFEGLQDGVGTLILCGGWASGRDAFTAFTGSAGRGRTATTCATTACARRRGSGRRAAPSLSEGKRTHCQTDQPDSQKHFILISLTGVTCDIINSYPA